MPFNPSSWLLKVVTGGEYDHGIFDAPASALHRFIIHPVRELCRDLRLDECLAPLPRLAYYLAATLHLSDLVRAQLKQGHVICDRYLASPLSLMIGESAIKETESRRLIESFGFICACRSDSVMTAGARGGQRKD